MSIWVTCVFLAIEKGNLIRCKTQYKYSREYRGDQTKYSECGQAECKTQQTAKSNRRKKVKSLCHMTHILAFPHQTKFSAK
tara:strand:+ start:23671 stop:23913 length:243 start_codon:yes stop_codon:yes gene_type:complete